MELSQGDMFILERENKYGVRSLQLVEYVKERSTTHHGKTFPVMNVLVEEL